jgi:4-carboxymuconolactone decarboxylase
MAELESDEPRTLYDDGLKLRREVLGDEYVDRSLNAANDFNRDFQRFITEYCWGGCWGRDALPPKVRSLVTMAMLAALGKSEELATHTRGALRNGCTVDELRDAMFHVTVYAGVPAGVEAFRVVGGVLREQGVT